MKLLAPTTGLEPATFSVTGRCATQFAPRKHIIGLRGYSLSPHLTQTASLSLAAHPNIIKTKESCSNILSTLAVAGGNRPIVFRRSGLDVWALRADTLLSLTSCVGDAGRPIKKIKLLVLLSVQLDLAVLMGLALPALNCGDHSLYP